MAEAGLLDPARLTELEPVAARYAVALTPALAALIDPLGPRRSHRPSVHPRCTRVDRRARRKRRPHRRSDAQPHRRDRAPLSRPRAAESRARLRGLLPVLFPARDGRAQGSGRPDPRDTGRSHRLYRRAPRHLGSDPDRRRSADPVAASAEVPDPAPGGDRPRQGHPRPHPPPGGGSERRSPTADPGAQGHGQGGVRRPARQPSARVDAAGPRRLRAPG